MITENPRKCRQDVMRYPWITCEESKQGIHSFFPLCFQKMLKDRLRQIRLSAISCFRRYYRWPSDTGFWVCIACSPQVENNVHFSILSLHLAWCWYTHTERQRFLGNDHLHNRLSTTGSVAISSKSSIGIFNFFLAGRWNILTHKAPDFCLRQNSPLERLGL